MAFRHGKEGYFALDSSTGLVDISQYLDNAESPETDDTAEVSTLGNDNKKYVAGMGDGTVSISGPFDPVVHALLVAAKGVERTFVHGPQGNTTGFVKRTGEVLRTSYNPSGGVGGAGNFSAAFQVTGGITSTTF